MTIPAMATTISLAGPKVVQDSGLVNTPNDPPYTQPPDNAQDRPTGQAVSNTQISLSRFRINR